MKRTLVPLLLCVAAFALPVAAQQPSLLSQAQKAYASGDVVTAKQLFQKVLVEDPQNVAALNFLKAINHAESQVPPGARTEKQLQALILPKVDFSNATLDSLLEALRQQALKASDGKAQVNFVVQPEVNVSTQVSLHLSNIPFTEVLKYVGALTKVDFVVDRYAIIVKPAAAKTVAQ